MKKSLLALLMLVILITTSSAQSPQSIPYQAVARNASGNLLVNQPVSLRFTIHETSGSGTVDYQETQSATTNSLGLFSANIGTGSRVSGSPVFTSIPWSNSVAKYTQVEIDPTGGTGYIDMGASQMMSVPYALYAGSANSVPLTAGSGIGVSGDQISETLPFTSLTTAGNNGAATISSGALNIPGYTLAGLGGIGLTALSANAPLTYNNATGVFGISQAATGTNGYLSSTDWNTFNSKEPPITAGTTTQYWRGDKTWQTLNTSVVPEGTNLYHTNARAITSTLTGYASTTGTITASDNILSAIEKLNGNLGSMVSGVSSVNGNTGAVALTGSSSISISGADVFSINSTYSGQSSITTLGTIGTGTWNGTAVGATYGGTGLNTSGSTGFPYVTSGTWSIISAATALTNLGALSTTSFNTAVSGTTGQVTYFNGTNSVTGSANHTWANATNELSVGLSSTTANPSLAVVGANAGGGVVTSTNSSTTAASSGIYGAETGAGTTYGVEGANSGNGGTGVYGLNNSTGTGSQYGVYGSKTGATGTGTGYGVYGTATGTGATNIAGYFTSSGGTANYGIIVPSGGGNVGVGTSTPGAAIEVSRGNGVSQAATQLTGTSADVVIQTLKGAAAPARLALVSNDAAGGNVSAGTIDGWSNAYGGGASKAVSINFPTSQGSASGDINGNIAFSVNNGTASTLTEAMRIQYNGDVGIGTAAPVQALDVNGVTLHRAGSTSASTTGNQILFGYAGTATYMHDIKTRHNGGGAAGNAIDFYVWNYAGSDATTAIGTKQVMTLDGTGYVGIGTTTPSGNLYINAANAGVVTGPSGSLVVNNLVNSAFTKGLWLSNTGGGTSYGIDIVGETFNGHTGAAPATIRFIDNNYATDIAFRVKTGQGSSNENNSDVEVMRVSSTNGWVGIGTPTPQAGLDVEINSGSNNVTGSANRAYIQPSSTGVTHDNGTTSGQMAIYANGYIASNSGVMAVSDVRMKNVIGESNTAEDLQSLNKIRVTNYTMKDKLITDGQKIKKVIAQQVAEVYPAAVKMGNMATYIPNIYQEVQSYCLRSHEMTAVMPQSIVINKDIKVGVKCKFYAYTKSGYEKELRGTILEIHENVLRAKVEGDMDQDSLDNRLFVYGTEIHDLLTVDYDAISMLNVSATQELAKQLAEAKAKNEELERQLGLVKATCNTIQEQNCDLTEKLGAVSANASNIQLLQKQLDDLKTLMNKNGIRSER